MLASGMNLFATESIHRVNTLNKNLTEDKISLNFQDIKVRSALQLLAEFSGYNFIIDEKVQNSLSLCLNNVSWQQALDTILQTQGLAKRPIAGGWFIATQSQILKQDKLNLEIQRQNQDLSPLIFRIFQVQYSKAADISKLLKDKENTLLSSHGSVNVDKRTNSLWVRDSLEQLNKIEKALKELDRPIEQVLIEARIVSIDQNREQELGAQFGTTQTQLTNKLLGAQLEKKAVTNPRVGLLHHLTMDLAMTGSSSISGAATVGLRLMRLGSNAFLDLELSALENEGAAQIISTPHLITADRETAFIEAGTEIPYQEKTSTGGSNVTFKKAVLSLKVTPRIMPDRRMMLDLRVNQDQPASFIAADVPAIKARGIKTQVIVKNGETVVLGGIYEYSHSKVVRRVPFLGALPLVGYLFRLVTTNSRRSELLIFLTPTILK
ncbi:MAG: type pilus assembly protein PilQ [Pseudomonadota bacterium]